MINKCVQAFPRSEYMRRLAAVKEEMARRDLRTLVVTDDSNVAYLLGYTAQSGYVPQGVIVSADRGEPTFLLRRQDAPAAIHQSFLDRDQVVGYPEALVGNPDENGFDAIIDLLHDLGAAEAGLGLELADLPAPDVDKFRRRLPAARIEDFTGGVTWLRIVKSDLEIAVMREAAAITDAAIRRAGEVLRPGLRESDAAAEIVAQLIRGVDGIPGTGTANSFFLCASPRTGTSHIPWTEDVLQPGAQVNLELSGVRHGYVAPIMRTFSLGTPNDRLRKVHEAELAGLEAALDAVEPGRTCGEVAEAFYRTAEAQGVTKESRCGYAVGINWTEPTASLKVGDPTILQPNMTFHLMLGNWMEEDFGYVISETFRVTESGADVLTRSPRDLLKLC